VTHACAFRYGLTVGLWPTDVRGLVGLGWFCAKPVQVPRCPPTHGTPFIVGTGPPETTVGAPLYPFWSNGSAPAVGATRTAAALKPTNSDLHRCARPAMADLLSPALQPAYEAKLRLTWNPRVCNQP
jgi:hypothetical protein